ncbi:hypothetical protein HOR51_gp01 [Ralstonia phage phiAp1]|uniref:Uncharacterized protein n=1 Tax=Ralstonia phage phiAp1 TaxID=2783867 RepID=A0A1L7DS17_9CAUD|nr:hypothetical protein HOR51_gp01 [Ralstonia phage phiAp1]APU03142.1 hypothetical protein phiAp1_01 [Ralstonia phage phiAp1]
MALTDSNRLGRELPRWSYILGNSRLPPILAADKNIGRRRQLVQGAVDGCPIEAHDLDAIPRLTSDLNGDITMTKATQAAPKRLTLVVGAANLNKAIASIKTRSAKLDADLHLVAVSCISHSAQHNDPDTMTRLIDALGKSARRQALIGWTLAYGAFTQDAAGKLVYDKTRRDAVLSDANIAAAECEPFWDFMPEKPYVQFDLEAAIKALLKKAETAIAKAEQDESKVPADKLAALRALADGAEVKVA